LHFKKVLICCHGGGSISDLDVPRYITLLNTGKRTLDVLITHEFSLDKANKALDMVRKGEADRCVIKMRD